MISIRLGKQCNKKQITENMISSLKKYPGCCDRVWLEDPYGYPMISDFQEFGMKMKGAYKKFTEAGFVCDAQMSNTISGNGCGYYMD